MTAAPLRLPLHPSLWSCEQIPLSKGSCEKTPVRQRPGVSLKNGKAEHQREYNARRHQHFRLPFAPLHDTHLTPSAPPPFLRGIAAPLTRQQLFHSFPFLVVAVSDPGREGVG